MKRTGLSLVIGFIALGTVLAQNPVAHWSFDDIRIEKRKAELVRGETYVPKEIFAYVKEYVSGKETELQGVY
jgi:hypothetical protein